MAPGVHRRYGLLRMVRNKTRISSGNICVALLIIGWLIDKLCLSLQDVTMQHILSTLPAILHPGDANQREAGQIHRLQCANPQGCTSSSPTYPLRHRMASGTSTTEEQHRYQINW